MHGHSHGGSGHTHHAGCSHGQQHHVQPEQYFQQLRQLKQKNRQFYIMQIMKGAVLAKYLQKYGLGFINSMNVQIIQSVVGLAHMMLTCEWMPLTIRPFVSGMFWPLLLYVFFNYKIITGFQNDDASTQTINQNRQINSFVFLLPVILYALVALRSSGNMKTDENKKKGKRILQIRPYLQNPNLQCRACEMPKAFRAMHCPMCKVCIPKFSRHSLVFGVCIGAANQLLAILFFLSLSIFSGYFLYKFMLIHSQFGIITQIMLFIINISLCYMSSVQFVTLFTLNLYIGLTEFEIQNWMMLQYLMKVPMRQFYNSCNTGILHNIYQDIYALLGISGFQAELFDKNAQNKQKQNQPLRQQISQGNLNSLAFPQCKQGVKYIVNWDKAYIYVVPQMPNHPKRNQIIGIMKIEEPRMIENFRLIKKFKKQVQDENPSLNQFQIQQKAMTKMQQHMMKNPQAMSMMKPPPEQQKAIQLQMIGHMKLQFKNDLEIFMGFQEIQSKLKDGSIGPDEAGLAIRAIQQKVMQKKMEQIMIQQQQAQSQKQNQINKSKQGQDNKQETVSTPTSLQTSIQAEMLKKLQLRAQQIVKEQAHKNNPIEQKKLEKEEQSDKLKQQEIVDDENL